MARRRFFVEIAEPGRAILRGEHAHHLYHVLRVKPGEVFEISDTRTLYLGRVTRSRAAAIEFVIEQELPAGPRVPPVTLLPAIFKFDRLEWMIEKATELGVGKIIPVIAARSDKGLAEAAVKRVERWRRIAFEAAQQARRLAPLEITQAVPLPRALQQAPSGRRWILDEGLDVPCGRELLAAADGSDSSLLVGPEGGWTEQERCQAVSGGFSPVRIGSLILRAETAAIAALAILTCARPETADGGRASLLHGET